MKEIYETDAGEVWTDISSSNEGECIFSVNFVYGSWIQANQVLLIFNEKGDFIEAKPLIYGKFLNKTMEETKQDHLLYALQLKEMAEKLIKPLIKPIKKEDIKIITGIPWANGQILQIQLELEGEIFSYHMDLEDPLNNYMTLLCVNELVNYRVNIHRDIPSLKGVRSYIRNHPKIRVKCVNELARYEQIKKQKEQEYKINLDDW